MNCIIENIEIDITTKKLKQMIFIFNAIENGWNVNKRGENYVFKKKHENKRMVYDDNFIENFISKNCNITEFIRNMN